MKMNIEKNKNKNLNDLNFCHIHNNFAIFTKIHI